MGGLGEKGKGIEVQTGSYQRVVVYIKYSIGNIVSNVVITMYGASWIMEMSGRILCKV